MFKIGDKVKVIKGLHNGMDGEVVSVHTNDIGTITYDIYVEKLFSRVGNISKKEGELKLMKKPGRPKKETTIEQLNEVTKEACELNDNQSILSDNLTDTKADEEPKAEVKEVEEPKSSFDQLVEAYDIMRRNLNVAQLSAFCDIVAKDVDDSKLVLEQMYQMSIEELMRIRKGLSAC